MIAQMVSGGTDVGQILAIICLVICLGLWVYFTVIHPIRTISDKSKTPGERGFAGAVLFILGIFPILYSLYTMWESKGNANSSNTGGNKPGNSGGAPNMPSAVAGSGQELNVQPPAPPAANVNAPKPAA